MDLFQEYKKQQCWRDWERYLDIIPYRHDDSVLALGCSVGNVSKMFSLRVDRVTGVDINQDFIDVCESDKNFNERFICCDFSGLSAFQLGRISGVWSSFSLSYLCNPLDFITYLYSLLDDDGWIALLDISCFISGNLPQASKYHLQVLNFELDLYKHGAYDFNFGERMQNILQEAGFETIYLDHDVTDPELNFNGAASQEIIDSWVARLNRMARLKTMLGNDYSDFCHELLFNLKSDTHTKLNNVRFVVARKPKI
ncbi:methyltransferase domain-containing protein [Aeromonas enteropelogenes]|uniref:class I SAM-dependent methyltransferase n=1 Tax=Aeromonas enteropelogenes TaxID=29489 RepID=UPI00191CC0B0|nr:class I SAM-dependent methyltransferase [Aeromonas enteropelogenes]MBL0521278.1 methyltransferase domain-containing protein [Aeromonas enteropelogenes]